MKSGLEAAGPFIFPHSSEEENALNVKELRQFITKEPGFVENKKTPKPKKRPKNPHIKVSNVSCLLVFSMAGQSEFKPYIRILNTLSSAEFTRAVIPMEGIPVKNWLAGDKLVSSLC